jgi:hypothetical protein
MGLPWRRRLPLPRSDDRGHDRGDDRNTRADTDADTHRNGDLAERKRPDARPIRPPARLRTVMILPPEPSRKSVNFVRAG